MISDDAPHTHAALENPNINSPDPFAPLSRKKRIGYAVGGVVVVVSAATFLGAMDGGFTSWELLRVGCIVGIPIFLLLAFVAWLSGGKRSEIGVGPAKMKPPIRLLKTMPYIFAAIALFYLMKLLEN